MIDLYKVGKYGIHEWARFKRTMKFVGEIVVGRTLDVGDKNQFGVWIEEHFNVEMSNTKGDLNKGNWSPVLIFDTIFVFEVIEHLMNPLLFLDELALRCHEGTRVFITYPSGAWVSWIMRMHYHEIPRARFRLLIGHSKFVEVRYEKVFLWGDWKYWLFRVRPFLRYVVFGFRYQYYELKICTIKKEN